MVSVTALRDAQDAIIGYLLIGTDNTARQLVEAEQKARSAPARPAVLHALADRSNIDALMTTDPPASSRTSTSRWRRHWLHARRADRRAVQELLHRSGAAEAAIKLVLSEKKVTNYELTARQGR